MADLEHMVKGEPDWHLKYNKNLDSITENIGAAESKAGNAVPKPDDTQEGILYQESDGTTSVIKTFPSEQYVYGVMIDEEDPNPAAVVYTDDARGFIPAYKSNMGSWEGTPLYRDIKPCLQHGPFDNPSKVGQVNYYIQKNNFNLKDDWTSSQSTLTGADGNVMIEFPKLYWDFRRQGKYLSVRIGNYKFTDTAVCYAHTDGINERDKIYVSAYKTYFNPTDPTSYAVSWSERTPTVSQTIAEFRNRIGMISPRHHIVTYWSKVMTSILALLMYKTRNLQQTLGEGVCRDTQYGRTTGGMNQYPFCSNAYTGTGPRGVSQIKFLGMEDYYGGLWEFVDGIVMTNYVYKATTDTSLFSDTGANYEKSIVSGLQDNTNSGTYMKFAKGTNEFPFCVDGSKPDHGVLGGEETYWSDGMWFNNTDAGYGTTICLQGGAWNVTGCAGGFCWYFSDTASINLPMIGSRLCYI